MLNWAKYSRVKYESDFEAFAEAMMAQKRKVFAEQFNLKRWDIRRERIDQALRNNLDYDKCITDLCKITVLEG
jgi:hypothetical protein